MKSVFSKHDHFNETFVFLGPDGAPEIPPEKHILTKWLGPKREPVSCLVRLAERFLKKSRFS